MQADELTKPRSLDVRYRLTDGIDSTFGGDVTGAT